MTSAAPTSQRSYPGGMKCQMAAEMILMSAIGNMNFQAKFMSWSIRKRGSVPRIQMNPAINTSNFVKNQIHDGTASTNANGACQPPRKSVMPSPLIANSPMYSPRKNSANLKPEYSM